jgi:hypothetical protein
MSIGGGLNEKGTNCGNGFGADDGDAGLCGAPSHGQWRDGPLGKLEQRSDDGTFSAATLNGTYIFEANGFMNDGTPGAVAVLGTLTFDGLGGVGGNLTMTAGDGGQFSCANTFTTGTYTLPAPVSGPGLGTLVIPAGTGVINFNLIVPSSEGKRAEAIDSENTKPTAVICTAPALSSMVLKGHLTRVGEGGGGGD